MMIITCSHSVNWAGIIAEFLVDHDGLKHWWRRLFYLDGGYGHELFVSCIYKCVSRSVGIKLFFCCVFCSQYFISRIILDFNVWQFDRLRCVKFIFMPGVFVHIRFVWIHTYWSLLTPSNPFTDEQLNFLCTGPLQIYHFSSLSIFCLGCKTISRRAALWLIALHTIQNIQSELKRQTC